MHSPVIAESTTGVRPRSLAASSAKVAMLVLLFSASALSEAIRTSALANAEVWLHLRTGLWILQNHSFPRSGLFSQYAALPWMDSTWGFDVLLATAYKVVGLKAIPILLILLQVALAVITFLLARANRAGFWAAVALSVLAQCVLTHLQPTPEAFSILCFGIELLILAKARRSGNLKILYWLPPLFIVWANLHVQFVAGLIVLGLFCLATSVEDVALWSEVRWIAVPSKPVPPSKAGVVAGLAFLATFLTPYFFHLIPTAYPSLYSDVGFQYFAEMRPMSFRHPQDFVLMLLVMAAFLALGRNRSITVFETLVLIGGTLLVFRLQRDSWMALLPALLIAASLFAIDQHEPSSARSLRWQRAMVVGIVAAIVVFAVIFLPRDEAVLSKVGTLFPVKACDYIAQNHLPAPVYNAYSWGDFLTWYLPGYPVAIDSRVDLYGNEIFDRYFKVTGGNERLDADPRLASARTLLLESQSGMAKALRSLPSLSGQYRLVYSDDLAAVFVRQ
jgi:hypothetical protein